MKDARERLRHVLWIGGGTGAGKSSVAVALAARYRLERYNWHDARGHATRSRLDRHPVRAALMAMSLDEQWVSRSPDEMAETTILFFAERFERVLEDLLALPQSRPIVAEGFGLLPELVSTVIAGPHQAIWLVPTPAFRVLALERRSWSTIDGTSDPERARANRLARDERITAHIRRSAEALGLRICEVDGSRTLAEITAEVERHFAPLLPASP